VAQFLDASLPADWRWFHTPNESGTRARWENQRLSALGVKPGVADVILLKPDGRDVWIELKSARGVLSEAQKGWRDWRRSIGAAWFLCRSLEDVVAALEDCGCALRGRIA
jgi:hypothetical protein